MKYCRRKITRLFDSNRSDHNNDKEEEEEEDNKDYKSSVYGPCSSERTVDYFKKVLREPQVSRFLYEHDFASCKYILSLPVAQYVYNERMDFLSWDTFMEHLYRHYIRRCILIRRVALIYTDITDVVSLLCHTLLSTVVFERIEYDHWVTHDEREKKGYRQIARTYVKGYIRDTTPPIPDTTTEERMRWFIFWIRKK